MIFVSVYTESNELHDRVANQWMNDYAGYSLRHYNETRINQRLESIENAVSVPHSPKYFSLLKVVCQNLLHICISQYYIVALDLAAVLWKLLQMT